MTTRLAFANGDTRNSAATAAERIWAHARFQNHSGSFYGVSGATWSNGRMPESDALTYADARRAGEIAYTICSYGTPIAYRLTDGLWVVPTATYSPTTGRHQSAVWAILRALDINTSFRWEPAILASGKPSRARRERLQTVFSPLTADNAR